MVSSPPPFDDDDDDDDTTTTQHTHTKDNHQERAARHLGESRSIHNVAPSAAAAR
jgi:hypothetical protein